MLFKDIKTVYNLTYKSIAYAAMQDGWFHDNTPPLPMGS